MRKSSKWAWLCVKNHGVFVKSDRNRRYRGTVPRK